MRFTYYEETHYVQRRAPQKKDNGEWVWGMVAFLLVAAGGVTNGWGGAAVGFLIAVGVIAFVSKKS